MSARDQHLLAAGPKRVLTLDGGGVRGLLTLGVLKRVETLLAGRSPSPEKFRLSDYFDLIGGTSTGAIMATLLALGKSVDEVTGLYYAMCPRIFGRRNFLSRFLVSSIFDAGALRMVIDEVFDTALRESGQGHLLADPAARRDQPTLGTDLLKTGLAVVAKRIDTSSLWVLTNNPRSKYWDPRSEHWRHVFEPRGEEFRPNRDYALRAVVQSSASAPLYLDPVDVEIAPGQPGLFLDGGVSHCNNPSLELFYMTTLAASGDGGNGRGLSPFGFGWETGADAYYMLSLGTGSWRERRTPSELKRKAPIAAAISALTSVLADTENNAVTILQALSDPPGGGAANGTIEDMRGLRMVAAPLLTFKRVAPMLEHDWLEKTLGDAFRVEAKALSRSREFTEPNRNNLHLLHRIGQASGERLLSDMDLPPQFDLPHWRRAGAGA